MSRGPQTSVEVQRTVQELVLLGYGKAQVYRELERLKLIDEGSSPSKSTIDRLVDRLKPADPSDPWSAMDSSANDAQLLLDVVAHVFQRTAGRVWPTTDLANWVVRVRERAPTVPVDWAYALGLAYQWSQTHKREIRSLDLTLAMEPWSSPEHAGAWAGAMRVLGESVNDWAGGGPGLVALAVQFPPPGWAGPEGSWRDDLWQLLLEVAKPQDGDAGNVANQSDADNNSTTTPVDNGA
jgi:hypothetical protein